MIQRVDERSTWTELTRGLFENDVYYSWDFLSVWAQEERARPAAVCFEDGDTRIVYPFLKVSLDALPGGAGWFDLRTPYDFGGPRIVGTTDEGALARFETAWRQYCDDERIVTEFARLHPFLPTARSGETRHHADNYVVDLTLSEQDLASRQHPNHRWAVRRALRDELDFAIDAGPREELVAAWRRMYADTMSRVGGAHAYRFSDRLFEALLGLPGTMLATVTHGDEPIAQALVVSSHPDLFYYLSASTESGRVMKATNYLLDRIIAYGRANGCRFFHLGGGSETLRHFKSQVATDTVPYHVLRAVHQEATYTALAGGSAGATEEFPRYLSRLRRRD